MTYCEACGSDNPVVFLASGDAYCDPCAGDQELEACEVCQLIDYQAYLHLTADGPLCQDCWSALDEDVDGVTWEGAD